MCIRDRNVARTRGPGLAQTLFVDLFLELHDPVDQRFGTGRTAGHVDVHRHHGVHALNDGVVVEDPAAAGAGAHGDHPLGLRHLVVDPLQHGGHLPVSYTHMTLPTSDL